MLGGLQNTGPELNSLTLFHGIFMVLQDGTVTVFPIPSPFLDEN